MKGCRATVTQARRILSCCIRSSDDASSTLSLSSSCCSIFGRPLGKSARAFRMAAIVSHCRTVLKARSAHSQRPSDLRHNSDTSSSLKDTSFFKARTLSTSCVMNLFMSALLVSADTTTLGIVSNEWPSSALLWFSRLTRAIRNRGRCDFFTSTNVSSKRVKNSSR